MYIKAFIKKISLSITAVLMLSSCGNIPIDKSFKSVVKQLNKLDAHSMSDLLSENSDSSKINKGTLTNNILCTMYKNDTKNPMMLIMDQVSFNLQLSGQLTNSGKLTASINPITLISGNSTGEYDITDMQNQQITFPVMFISLEDIPFAYYKQQMYFVSTSPSNTAKSNSANTSPSSNSTTSSTSTTPTSLTLTTTTTIPIPTASQKPIMPQSNQCINDKKTPPTQESLTNSILCKVQKLQTIVESIQANYLILNKELKAVSNKETRERKKRERMKAMGCQDYIIE
jgi:hypothetical protein